MTPSHLWVAALAVSLGTAGLSLSADACPGKDHDKDKGGGQVAIHGEQLAYGGDTQPFNNPSNPSARGQWTDQIGMFGRAGVGNTEKMAARQGSPKMMGKGQASRQDIVETATQSGSFNTLAQAIQAAGLVDVLKGEGPFTVFAPTDAAFAALPPGTLDELLKPENRERLMKILQYHVVSGNVSANEVVRLRETQTVEGNPLKISVEKQNGTRTVMVNDAKVIQTDVAAKNGVIHAIDKVLIPAE